MSLIQKEALINWEKSFSKGIDKKYPNLDMVRLIQWHFGSNLNENILEYGFGTGSNSLHIIESGYNYYGIDICEGALNLTASKIKDKFPNLKYDLKLLKESDDKLPYPDNFFDNIICLSVLSLLGTEKNIRELLVEFKRILKKGGKIIIDINDHDSEFSKGNKMIEENVFLTPSNNDLMPFKSFCLKDEKSFNQLISSYFEINDSGYSCHKLFGRRINEWIICATN